ncbi:hypothetical protein Cenrod_1072 [Candidatus Symbiobacter mobilis CR]|uniref:Uncharacterized protein n=1 Tax=Candidatus Symbiobacter mobilis CR TaxID=946483 RepID=U5N6K0_9BURK|nr:hypothetical protein Cenrod_1072 [Candidatus Symbiobacter mobilis CR]
MLTHTANAWIRCAISMEWSLLICLWGTLYNGHSWLSAQGDQGWGSTTAVGCSGGNTLLEGRHGVHYTK